MSDQREIDEPSPTIVGPRPKTVTGGKLSVPQGLERLLVLAGISKDWREKILARPISAALEAGIELSAGERAILTTLSRSALAGMIAPFAKKNTAWRISRLAGAAVFTTAALLAGAGKSYAEEGIRPLEMRIYDVTSLISSIPDFPSSDYSPPSRGATNGEAPQANCFGIMPAVPGPPTLTAISQMIHDRVRPESWDPALGTSIDERAGHLVVMQTPEVHKLIGKLLNDLSALEKTQIVIKGLLMTANDLPKETYFDSAMLAKLSKSAGETAVLARPRIVCYNTQRTHIVSGKEFSYIGNYNIVGDMYEPESRMGLDGYVLDVKPILSEDRKTVQVEVRFTLYTNVQNTTTDAVLFASPIQKASPGGEKAMEGNAWEHSGTAKMPVDIPTSDTRKLRTQIVVPEGQWVLAGTFSNPVAESKQKDKYLLFFISAELAKQAK